MFKDRKDAALRLSKKLKDYKNSNAVIIAIPKGGLPIGLTLAEELNLNLDIIITKKIGHPNNPEFAIGSVGLKNIYLDEKSKEISENYINEQIDKLKFEIKTQYAIYRSIIAEQRIIDRTIILVDDGMATGNTILASIMAIKTEKPKKIIIAVPVASEISIKKIKPHVNEIICLLTPELFLGVGQFYENFNQISLEQAKEILKEKIT